MKQTSAIFETVEQAAAAVRELKEVGIPSSSIHYLGSETSTDMNNETISANGDIMNNAEALKATEDTATSMLAGAGIGAVLGVAALAIPVLGPAVAAGVVTTAAIPGAMVTGGILGAAAGGIKEGLEKYYDVDDAAYYSEQIDQGRVLIAVDTENDAVDLDEVRHVLVRNGGMRRVSE